MATPGMRERLLEAAAVQVVQKLAVEAVDRAKTFAQVPSQVTRLTKRVEALEREAKKRP